MMARRAGFTFVELLITVSLLGLVAAAIVAIFLSAFQVWDRVVGQGTDRQRLEVAWSQVRQDLHRLKRFELIGFKGAYDEMSFPVLLDATWKTEQNDVLEYQELGQAGYYFDRYHRLLCRSQVPYRLLRKRRLKDACDSVLTGVDYVRFSYYTRDPQSGRYEWSGSWSADEVPAAVKLEVRLESHTMKQMPRQSVIVPVPIATIPKHPTG